MMKMDMIQKLTTKSDMNHYKLRVQPVKKMAINIKIGKNVIAERVCIRSMKVIKEMTTLVVMMLLQLNN